MSRNVRGGTAWKRMNCERLRSLEIWRDVPTVPWVSRSSVKVAVTAQGSTPAGKSPSSDARPACEPCDVGNTRLLGGSAARASAGRFVPRSVAVAAAVMRESRSWGDVSNAGASDAEGKKVSEVDSGGAPVSFLGRVGGGRRKVQSRPVCLYDNSSVDQRQDSAAVLTHLHSTHAPPSLVIAQRFFRFLQPSHGRIFLLCDGP